MKVNIDLSNLKDVGSFKNIKKQFEISDLKHYNQEIKTPYPFNLDLNIYNTEDYFVFSGSFTGILLLVCSRCLDKFEHKIELKIDEEIDKDNIPDKNNFQIGDMLKENIILTLPMKHLCSEECEGLCSVCGNNLNQHSCDCDTEVLDPRLTKLKDFFKDKDED
ncbi:YceD family protein [Natronospora cellulosivora (SeqCode)]